MMVQFWGYDAIFIFDKFYVVFASQKDLQKVRPGRMTRPGGHKWKILAQMGDLTLRSRIFLINKFSYF